MQLRPTGSRSLRRLASAPAGPGAGPPLPEPTGTVRAALRRGILPCLVGGALAYVATWLAWPGLYGWAVGILAPIQAVVAVVGLWRDPVGDLVPLRVALLVMAFMAVARWFVLPSG